MAGYTWARGRQGDWLIRGEPAMESRTVTVSRKDGSTSTVTLGRQIWQGDGVALYVLGQSHDSHGHSQSSRGRDSEGNAIYDGSSYRAGMTAPRGRTCPMCGSRECERAWDPHGLCCED